MRFLWDPTPYLAVSPEAAQKLAIASWCHRFFGAEYAEAASSLLEGYYYP